MLSPYKFYQYFISVPDVNVVRFLNILIFLNLEEIQELEKAMKKPSYLPNLAQKRLAEEVTRFVHGEEGLTEAVKATKALKPGSETELDPETIEGIASSFLANKSSARRLIKQGGFYLNNKKVDNEGNMIEEFDIVSGKLLLLSARKKNKMVIKIS
ncbi:hypothetical protein KFK09_022904 [Dendrobium nobile]|uniref:RNA-binding S4 domain-containing protein n=1 Tax=Dendrobium nobile TaxID=94219 RepID=A0A8T3AKL2_DENNO|nr:hypothetical protein KFK09_022904 [Dendrobium nobile]